EDGHQDLVAGDAGFNGIAVMLGNGHGTFTAPVIYNDGTQNAGVEVGDWNHDGILDLATGDGRNNVLYALLGNGAGGVGSGTFGPAFTHPAGLVSFPLTAGDLNADGFVDLITCNHGEGTVSVFLGGCTPGPPPPPPNTPLLT